MLHIKFLWKDILGFTLSLLLISLGFILLFSDLFHVVQTHAQKSSKDSSSHGDAASPSAGWKLSSEAADVSDPVSSEDEKRSGPFFDKREKDKYPVDVPGDRCGCIAGRLVMKNGAPLPSNLKITAVHKRPPLSPIMNRKGRGYLLDNFTCREELLKSIRVLPVHPNVDGSFLLEGVCDDEIYLYPVHPYLRFQTLPEVLPESKKELEKRETGSNTPFILVEGGVVEGEVLDPEGFPVDSARISLFEEFNPFAAFSGRGDIFTLCSVNGSEGGRFRFEQVPAGHRLTLEASKPGFAPAREKYVRARKGEAVHYRIHLQPPSLIEGTVESPVGAPQRGITVRIYKSELFLSDKPIKAFAERESDERGVFCFEDLSAGEYMLQLFEPGMVRDKVKGIRLSIGEEIRNVRLVLKEGLSICGIVKDEKGHPLANAEVEARQSLDFAYLQEGMVDQLDPLVAITGMTGEFRIAGLEESAYDLEISADGFSKIRRREIHAGDRKISIAMERGGCISGIAVAADTSEAVRSYSILARARNGEGRSWMDPFAMEGRVNLAVHDDKGEFTLTDLASGNYDLVFSAESYGIRRIRNVRVTAGAWTRGIIAVLPRESCISGRVKDSATKQAVEGVRISQKSGMEGLLQGLTGEESTFTDHSGEFRLSGLPDGPVRLVASHPRFEETSVGLFHLSEGESLENVEIYLDQGSTLGGRITSCDDTPLQGIQIIVSDVVGSRVKSAMSDSDGRYEIHGLSHGAYTVTKMPQTLFFDGEGLKDSWLSAIQTRTVRIGEDETYECDFVVGASGGEGVLVEGVVREKGRPVNRTIVSILPMDCPERSLEPKTTSTMEDGCYRFEGVSPGRYTFRVVKTSSITRGAACEVVFQARVPHIRHFVYDLDLPGGALSGQVRDRGTKTPLESVRIILRRDDSKGTGDPLSEAMGNRVADVYTDSQGRFRINNLHAGAYSIRAGGGNLFGMDSGGYALSQVDEILLEENGIREGIVIDLEKGGTLEGRVLDPLGFPLSGAALYVRTEGQERLETYTECVTDAGGFFRYPGVKAGECAVTIKHPDFAMKTRRDVVIRRCGITRIDVNLDYGIPVYVKGAGDFQNHVLKEATIEFIDGSNRNVYGWSSISDVLDRLFCSRDFKEKGTLLGRFSPGEYSLKVIHPTFGIKKLAVRLQPGEQERVVIVFRN